MMDLLLKHTLVTLRLIQVGVRVNPKLKLKHVQKMNHIQAVQVCSRNLNQVLNHLVKNLIHHHVKHQILIHLFRGIRTILKIIKLNLKK